METMLPVNPPPKPRGRPRNTVAREAMLRAAAQLIEQGGIGAVTMEAVALRAGVGNPTVYRNWPNREALAMAALLATADLNTTVRQTVSALDDLKRQLRKVARVFTSPQGRNAALMAASADSDSELSKAFRNQVMQASREEGRALLVRATAEGEIRLGFPIEVVLDMIYGPVFYRLMMGHAPVGEQFTAELLEQVLRGLRE